MNFSRPYPTSSFVRGCSYGESTLSHYTDEPVTEVKKKNDANKASSNTETVTTEASNSPRYKK